MKITGRVHEVLEPVQGMRKNGDPFVKREFSLAVMREDGLQDEVAFVALGDKRVEESNRLTPGALVDVYFSIQSNKHENRYYTQLIMNRLTVYSKTVAD